MCCCFLDESLLTPTTAADVQLTEQLARTVVDVLVVDVDDDSRVRH